MTWYSFYSCSYFCRETDNDNNMVFRLQLGSVIIPSTEVAQTRSEISERRDIGNPPGPPKGVADTDKKRKGV